MSIQLADEDPDVDKDGTKPLLYAQIAATANESNAATQDDEHGISAVLNDVDDEFKQRHETKIGCIGRRASKPPIQRHVKLLNINQPVNY